MSPILRGRTDINIPLGFHVTPMKRLTLILLSLTSVAFAQPAAVRKIASEISTASLRDNLFYLASDKMEGRMMATKGDTLASIFIADWFKINKLVAPYKNGRSYFQAVTSYKITSKDNLVINGKNYDKPGNWMSSKDFSSAENTGVLLPFFSDPDSLLKALSNIDTKGKTLVIPSVLLEKTATNETFLAQLSAKGIVATMNYGALVDQFTEYAKKNSFLPQYTDSTGAFGKNLRIGSFSLTTERMDELLASDALTVKVYNEIIKTTSRSGILELKTKVSAEVKKSFQKIQAPNVIGMIKGSDPDADCIVVSAHHDHDGRNGSEIYYGAVDNASGTVAIMEMAAMMNKASEKGFRPKRTIIFASFTGEERGLLGSYYYVDHPITPIKKTRAIMNIDMMGRVDTIYSGKKADSSYAYILVKDSLNIGLRTALFKANDNVKLKLDTRYEQPQFAQRRIRGSDQYPFYKKGVPFVRIDCGFAKEYHKPEDTPDKINYALLTKQTQLAFLTLWNMAND